MTDTAAARRPSPRPRPADTDPGMVNERPNLRVVPPHADPVPVEPEACTVQPDPAGDPTPTAEIPQVSASDGAQQEAEPDLTAGLWARTRHLAGRTRQYWTPPALLTEAPATLADLADYAHHAPWTAQDHGPLRKAGVAYWTGVALPYTGVSRYREWVIQRPGRLTAHLAVIKLFAHTTAGLWVVDHLVYPVAQFAGHLFL